MKRRDKQEGHLDTLQEQTRISKEQIIRVEKGFTEALAVYQEWKKTYNIEGLKY